MQRKFILNLVLLIFINLLIKPIWIYGIEREVQNAVGVSNFGFYFSLFNFSMILNILLDMGITNYNNRNIAQHSHLLSKYLSSIVALKFSLGFVYGIIAFLIALIIGYDSSQLYILLFFLLNQFLISLTLYLRSNISGLHLFKTDSFLSVTDKTIMIIISYFLLSTHFWGDRSNPTYKIEWLIYTQTVAYLLTALITFFIVLTKAEFFKLKFNKKIFILILKQSYPFALLIFLMSVYNRIDSVLLERLLPETGRYEAGVYAQAFRNLDAVSMFGVLFAGLLIPIFAKMIKQKQAINELVQMSYLILLVPAIILASVSYYYNVEIMNLMYDNHAENSSQIFSILMFGFIFIATTYIFGSLLTANGSMKSYNIMAAVGLLINIILNFVLIPEYKALGAAIASLATQIFAALTQILIVRKIFKMKVNFLLITKIIIYFMGVMILGYFIKQFFTNFIIGLLALSFSGVIYAFTINLINLKSLYMIIKYDKGK